MKKDFQYIYIDIKYINIFYIASYSEPKGAKGQILVANGAKKSANI